MSSYDITFCETPCERKDCRRNLKYNKPDFLKYHSVSPLGEDDKSEQHIGCDYYYPLSNKNIKEDQTSGDK